MFRARPLNPNRDFSTSLTQNVSSYLACGPLKVPEVMSALIGRDIVPAKDRIFTRGYALVKIYPYTRTNPIFLPNPEDFSVISFALYKDLTVHELRILAGYNGIGSFTEASLETFEFGNHSMKHLIHRLKAGVPFRAQEFSSENQVFEEEEMRQMSIEAYTKEAAALKKWFNKKYKKTVEGSLPIQSRK